MKCNDFLVNIMMKKLTAFILSMLVLLLFFLFLYASSLSFSSRTVSSAIRYEQPDARIDINSADSELLQTLPGVGPVLSEAIVDWRSEHGTFRTKEELLQVPGIGEKTLNRLADMIILGGIDENTDR